FLRIINNAKLGIGKITLSKIEELARKNNLNFHLALKQGLRVIKTTGNSKPLALCRVITVITSSSPL
ncbi:unnamed protein product, partial [marine sediment metagenome]